VVTSIYSDDMMKYIGYIEICVGLGLGMGPVIGSAVYSALEYEGTMYLFAGFNLMGTLACVCMIPSELNQTLTEEEQAEIEAEIEEEEGEIDDITIALRKKKRITLCTLFTDRFVVAALFACFLGTFNLTFWSSWLSKYMVDNLDFNETNFGYVLGTTSVTYLIGCLLLPYTCEAMPRRL
jgi:predicted MFS family arabinose efflux permease